MKLNHLGWNDTLEEIYKENNQETYMAGRISSEHKNMYRILTENGECLGEVSGKFRFQAISREDFPAVGDWVLISERNNENKATIHKLMPRFSKFSRKVAGSTTEEQIIAANVDIVFLVQSLNQDLNLRRLERYLLMAWESGANPVIVLTKSDLCENVEDAVNGVETVAFGVPIHPVSVVTGSGLAELAGYFSEGKTIALLGSSGAGKSTLTNYFLGEDRQLTQHIREDDSRGRHTTTSRELLLLPNGGLIIDTPGMRELQLWDADEGLSIGFSDIEELAKNCQFRDCSHQNEPNCAIRSAINNGEMSESRLESFFKLQKELAYLERKTNKKAQLAEKAKWKKIQTNANQSRKR